MCKHKINSAQLPAKVYRVHKTGNTQLINAAKSNQPAEQKTTENVIQCTYIIKILDRCLKQDNVNSSVAAPNWGTLQQIIHNSNMALNREDAVYFVR